MFHFLMNLSISAVMSSISDVLSSYLELKFTMASPFIIDATRSEIAFKKSESVTLGMTLAVRTLLENAVDTYKLPSLCKSSDIDKTQPFWKSKYLTKNTLAVLVFTMISVQFWVIAVSIIRICDF